VFQRPELANDSRGGLEVKVNRFCLVGLLVALTAVFGTASASAAVSVGHSGWTWGNPLPQGNDINGLEFLGSQGYAAGKFGTLLKTDDAGSTWTGLSTGIVQDLSRVRIIDSDSLVFAGGCAVRRSDNGGQSFTRLPWTASDLNCPDPIVSLSFPTDQVGYLVVKNGNVFRTADGGKTWSRRTAIPGTQVSGGGPDPTDVFFTAADAGVATTAGGRVYRTTDGGGSWTLVLQTGKALNGIYFVDASTGYVVGDSSSAFKTTDAGATWADKSLGGSPANIKSIRCSDALNCLATVATGELVYRTNNGATTFSSVTPSTDPIYAAAFASSTRTVAAGKFGTTVVSNDGGATWSAVGGRIIETFRRLRATSATTAFAPGDNGALARTLDSGATWTTLGVSTSADVIDVAFPTQQVGFALDSNGSVLRTDNGGASWQILNTGTTSKPFAIVALDANRILLIGPRGIRRSTNGGNEFSRVKAKGVARARVVDFDRVGNTLFVYGPKALFVSTNGGKTWKKAKLPKRTSVNWIDFVSSRAGFALGFDGRLWQTRNRGRTWKELPGLGTDDVFDISFSNAKRGYAALNIFGGSDNAYVLRTNDGGKTWRPQLVADSYVVSSGLVATGDNTALLLAGANSLFSTSTGGDAGTPSKLTLRTKKRKLRKAATIKITGRLSPPEGGEQAVVSMREARGKKWSSRRVTIASNGSFTTSWKVKRTSIFVAQWIGDDDRAPDGSSVLTVTVKGRR
jgi:photosystem II stability/assembly factor-like uncharacterized protein